MPAVAGMIAGRPQTGRARVKRAVSRKPGTRTGAGPGQEGRQQKTRDEDKKDLEPTRPPGLRNRVPRQEVVEDGGVDLGPRLGGFQRCGPNLMESRCSGPEDDHLPLQRVGVCRAVKDCRGGNVGEGVAAAAEVHQEVPSPVEGDAPPFQSQRFDPLRPCLQDRIAAAGTQEDGQGEARVEEAPVADHQGNAPQHPVGVRSDIEKGGRSCRPRQDGEVADDSRGVEESRGAFRLAVRAHRRTQRVQDARLTPPRVEIELVAENEGAAGKGLRQSPVGVHRLRGDPRQADAHPKVAADFPREGFQRRPVGFGEDHVEAHRRGAPFPDPLQETGHPVAGPWPLSQSLEAGLVEVH